jgi:3-dehydroquinate synthetase
MERAAWTNERLEDLAEGTRSGFARVDHDIRDLRGEIGSLRTEMREGFQQVRGEINDLRTEFRAVMFRVGGGVIVGLFGVIAAILARGV